MENQNPEEEARVEQMIDELMRKAKESNIAMFIIGHITKDGSIAGPRVLEHMVDTVLYFEGEASRELRMLRGFKNRFGSTSEIGIFEMTAEGLISAKDIASKFFDKSFLNSLYETSSSPVDFDEISKNESFRV